MSVTGLSSRDEFVLYWAAIGHSRDEWKMEIFCIYYMFRYDVQIYSHTNDDANIIEDVWQANAIVPWHSRSTTQALKEVDLAYLSPLERCFCWRFQLGLSSRFGLLGWSGIASSSSSSSRLGVLPGVIVPKFLLLSSSLLIEGLLPPGNLVLAVSAHFSLNGLSLPPPVLHGDSPRTHLALLGTNEATQAPIFLAVGVAAVFLELVDALLTRVRVAAVALADHLVRDARSADLGLDLGLGDY